MTNSTIIYQAALAHGFTVDQLAQLLDAGRGELPFHTFAEWKARGYHVKRGEHAIFTADLWKFTDKPTKAAREAAQAAGEEIPECSSGHYYRKTSHLFSAAQVEKDQPAGT